MFHIANILFQFYNSYRILKLTLIVSYLMIISHSWKQRLVLNQRMQLSMKTDNFGNLNRDMLISSINDIMVKEVSSDRELSLPSLIKNKSSKFTFLVFLTHLGDLGSWELAQKLVYYLPKMRENGINLVAVAPGNVENAKLFCEMNDFPISNLYMDKDAECYRKLDFSKGAFPNVPVSPYLKLLPMLAGIESKGTIAEVLRGYFGDKTSNASWIQNSLKLVKLQKSNDYQQPFELATLRLQNMIDVLKYWNDLIPENLDLITQQGGAYMICENRVLYEFKDTGILAYCDVERAISSTKLK